MNPLTNIDIIKLITRLLNEELLIGNSCFVRYIGSKIDIEFITFIPKLYLTNGNKDSLNPFLNK